jgi:1,4-alpha-glucan branching enzyme
VQQKREEKERLERQRLVSSAREYRLSAEIARDRQAGRRVPMSLQSSPALATEFAWPYAGQQVFIIGTFSCWRDKLPLEFENGVWKTTLKLFPGTYQFKFIVDNAWCFDSSQPTSTDNNGNTNNVIRVAPKSNLLSQSSAW